MDCSPSTAAEEESTCCSSPSAASKPSYIGMFIFGEPSELEKSMDILESHRIIEGVTVGCEVCGYVSVISHTYHRHERIVMDRAAEDRIPNRSEYYTQMCMLAQRISKTQSLLKQCKK